MRAIGTALAIGLMVLYPVGIWIGLTHFGARTIAVWVILVLLPLLAWRWRRARVQDRWAVLRVPLMVLGVVSLGAILDDRRFVLAMPVLINAVLLFTFAASLATTPMVERFARMQEKEELTAGQVAHCRQVTVAWCVFFVLNGAASATLALAAPVSWWASYTGGVAYALMGVMFCGEYVLRQYRFRRYGAGPHDRLLARIFPPREGSS